MTGEVPSPDFKLKPESVRTFQDRLQDDRYRKSLAAYFAVQRALRPESPFTPATDSGLREIAWLAVDDYVNLTRAANADTWPEDISAVEVVFKAAQDMDREDYA